MVGDGRTVFLSYAEADEPWAVWVAWQLREAGYRPRLQAWHSVPGGNFVGWIRAELMAASCVMVILSPAYLDSKWCKAELNAALADAVGGKKLLVPVRVAPCEAPPLLREIGRISLVDRSAADAHRVLVDGLMAATNGEAAPSAVAPGYPAAGDRGQPPRFPGPDNGELRLRLLGLVQEACRERHPEATVHGGHREGPFPYVDMSGERDGERRRWPVGISVNAPDAGAVEAFYDTVVRATYLPLEPWPDSELVYLGEPPGEEVLRQARRRRVRLFSLAEFEGRWDPRRYLARQKERAESSGQGDTCFSSRSLNTGLFCAPRRRVPAFPDRYPRRWRFLSCRTLRPSCSPVRLAGEPAPSRCVFTHMTCCGQMRDDTPGLAGFCGVLAWSWIHGSGAGRGHRGLAGSGRARGRCAGRSR
ncbi:toll/interleukin-1 receptor domain-containing protein [Frankia sp. Cj3]|uniref:toll/interleukin-1 receptor domain-containing protein n=1 Tax=Frankia sp. Cj3 TaxID=2880976 RepID=UPI001EF6298A|nr:toll/interleukin-1 receptor domain-containing protein [Frankia sp. Cj3]